MRKLEVIADSVESVMAANEGGADRIELCANLLEGGTTPSYGLMKKAKEVSKIPVFAMIRPRGGDFVYSDNEFEVMKEDIIRASLLGMDGFVSGVLFPDNTIDYKRTEELAFLAKPAEFTFHRAFDFARDPLPAIDKLAEIGVNRILTSGQAPTAVDGVLQLGKYIKRAAGKLIIMPGSGITSQNLNVLLKMTSAQEYHTSAKVKLLMSNTKINLGRGENPDFPRYGVSIEEVRILKEMLKEK